MSNASHDSETPAQGQQIITACAFIHHSFMVRLGNNLLTKIGAKPKRGSRAGSIGLINDKFDGKVTKHYAMSLAIAHKT